MEMVDSADNEFTLSFNLGNISQFNTNKHFGPYIISSSEYNKNVQIYHIAINSRSGYFLETIKLLKRDNRWLQALKLVKKLPMGKEKVIHEENPWKIQLD